ncbi:hypothetical protein A2572_04580 [Candidatus Collierbacteria bacterium RIFOXYD1_FULL_40_9]|uniref:Uncharacterized protein n=1 Tax=Candidatus Collierbacteria bacterium RIFOXYD1_FULL_40_9 TaxID=1817731 RepID=A0A1F5FTX6_9BACT|nr:MAG: hypothetical protein A2572_04580 [Candidatus Collierbacteria bacterium RIFOXYD1_FULL_40_9]
MKNKFTKIWSDATAYTKKQYQLRPHLFQAVLVAVGLIALGLIAVWLVSSMRPSTASVDQVALPIILQTATADPMRQAATPQLTPTPTPMPTNTPIPSNLWVVNRLLGKQTINGYTALVVEFKNLATGELHNGQCQSPADPAPVIGDVYFMENMGSYLLLSPYSITENRILTESRVQRFILVR